MPRACAAASWAMAPCLRLPCTEFRWIYGSQQLSGNFNGDVSIFASWKQQHVFFFFFLLQMCCKPCKRTTQRHLSVAESCIPRRERSVGGGEGGREADPPGFRCRTRVRRIAAARLGSCLWSTREAVAVVVIPSGIADLESTAQLYRQRVASQQDREKHTSGSSEERHMQVCMLDGESLRGRVENSDRRILQWMQLWHCTMPLSCPRPVRG